MGSVEFTGSIHPDDIGTSPTPSFTKTNKVVAGADVDHKISQLDKKQVKSCLSKFDSYLLYGTLQGLYEKGGHVTENSITFSKRYPDELLPASREQSFLKAFELLIESPTQPKVVVEVGVTRSFRDGTLAQDLGSFDPHNPSAWDWGAGSFTRVASECLQHVDGMRLLAVDLSEQALFVARTMAENYSFVSTHHMTSSAFIKAYSGPPVTLFYSDLGDPVGSEGLHLEEAKLLTANRDTFFSEEAYVLIDDVRNMAIFQSPSGQPTSERPWLDGKSRDSIPYYVANGWQVVFAGYQWLLKAPPKGPIPVENTARTLER